MKFLEDIPDILYKYRDIDNEFNRRTLFNFELFLSSTSKFNDPYEGSIPFEYDPDDLTEENIFLKMRSLALEIHPDWNEQKIQEFCFEGQKNNYLLNEEHKKEINRKNKEQIEKTFGILSLTKNPFNYLMWSHYSKSHTGFCIGFDKFGLFKTVNGSLGKVNYSSKIPRLKLFENIAAFHTKQLVTKSIVWNYEDEYRIVLSKAANKAIGYSKEIIEKIFLGCNMDNKDKYSIIEFIKSNNMNCEIYELSLDKEFFKLNSLRVY